MSILRRVAIVAFTPLFALGFGLVWLHCAVDRLLRPPLGFPRDPEALAKRPGWCLKRLVAGGAFGADATVEAVVITPFKQGEAFRSALATIVVTGTHADGAPLRFEGVAKFAPTGGSVANRAVFVLQRLHVNEVSFYNRLARADDPLTPTAYYARAASLSGNFCVLLARLPDVVEHTEEGGCPLDAAHVAVGALARFHARHWGAKAKFPPKIAGFTIDFACSLAWGRRRKVLRHLARRSWHHGNAAQTIVHGDARVGNMLFRRTDRIGRPPAPPRAALHAPTGRSEPPAAAPGDDLPLPTLIDWQAVRWGLGAFDLCYFVLLSLDSATREAHQDALVAAYHGELVAGGVTDYDLAALREDYRHSLVLVGSLLVVPLLGGEVTVDAANAARILSGALVWNQRLVRALEVLDTAWLADRYGVDADTLRETIAYAARHPPVLNRGAVLVADHLAHEEARGA